jgi:prevent-host-death family protein
MKYSAGIEPVTVLKSKSARLINRVRETGQPLMITVNGKAAAVLQDVETYERQQQALLLLKFLAAGDKELKAGKGVSHAQATAHFQGTLARLRHG